MELLSLSTRSESALSLVSYKLSTLFKGEVPDNLRPYVECQGVRITPGQMIFDNAIEGKSFNEKITLQNLGKSAAFIRILAAHSYAFRINPILRGVKLSPGLSLERHITFQCLRATSVSTTILPIFVNNERIDYRLFVLLSTTDVKAEPTSLNFGTINAGNNAVVRMLSIRNDGTKGSRFTIDLGRNDMDLLVEPSKGIIQPNSITKFRVECLGTSEGQFTKEFWIKCETPLRIGVTGKIIYPILEAIHPNATTDFTLIDFPKTYVGTSFSKTFVLKNYSSVNGAFCTLIENAKELLEYREGIKIDPNAFNFKVVPTEGIMEPFEARIFEFTFTPKISKKVDRRSIKDMTSFCCFRITRIPFSSLPKIENIVVENEYVSDEFGLQHIDDTVSITSGLYSLDESSMSLISPGETKKYPSHMTFQSFNTRIVLFGEAELPKVIVRPDELTLGSIKQNECTSREILLRNHSLSLPIIFQYRKVCYVSISPTTATLPPDGKLELIVNVNPTALGSFSIKINFDLLFYNQPRDDQDLVKIGSFVVPLTFNVPSKVSTKEPKFNMGITPTYIKEVGMYTSNVRFNTNIKMPKATLMEEVKKKVSKDDSDLVAFPNDRPQSLRPWRSNVKCRTICGKIYRTMSKDPDEYQLSEKELILKKKANEHFREMIDQQIKFRKIKSLELKSLVHYNISNSKELLLENFPKFKCPSMKWSHYDSITGFIPLMPSQLYKVTVSPSCIDLGKVAPKTHKSDIIVIDNKSNSCIAVFLKSRKPAIYFPDGQFLSVESMQTASVTFSYKASNIVGSYFAIIDCIINCCDTFTVSVSVDVTPKCVRFPFEDVILDNTTSKFLVVTNPVNVQTSFTWHLPESCFTIEPMSATIPSYSSITCFIKYMPHQFLPYTIDATLCSENGAKQIVNIAKYLVEPKIKLRSSVIEFQPIPVNTTVKRSTGIENLINEPVTFEVENPQPIPGISITPVKGLIYGYSEQIFEIRIRISTCLSFKCPVTVNIQNRTTLEMILIGTVIYPHIVFKPDVMKLRKIVSNSFERQVFVVVNKSNAPVTINFCLNDYVEYTILESRNIEYSSKPLNKIEIEANSQKELYLFFNPMGAALFSFYLPIIVNEVFGPPVLNCCQTLNPNFYTNTENAKYVSFTNVQILTLPKKLPVLFINSTVGSDILKFSKLNFNFKFFSHYYTYSDTKSDLIIWNASQDICKFCIRTDSLRYPFTLQFVSGKNIQFLQYSIVITLEPKEEIIFKVIFNPALQGTYFTQLPIYLRNYLDGNVFNYLTFSGFYPSAAISSEKRNLYFESVPTTCETEQKLLLNLEFHSKNCTVSSESDSKEIRMQFCEKNIYHGEGTIIVNVKYSSKSSVMIDSSINFCCTCGANCRIYIKGAIENCCVTNNAFVANFTKQTSPKKDGGTVFAEQCDTSSSIISLYDTLSNYNITSFPFFPSDEDQSDYANHMRCVVTALEEWISHQALYGKRYYKIPDVFAVSPESLRLNEFEMKKKKTPPTPLKYIEVLLNLVGTFINSYVTIKEIPADNLERINYMFNTYRQALNFVASQGAYLSHVNPENLLPYNDHVLFIKYIYPNKSEFMGETPPDILNKESYYLLCKQHWIDVLLQTYKVFVLGRVAVPIKYRKDSYLIARPTYRSMSTSIGGKDNYVENVFVNTSSTESFEDDQSISSFKILDESEFWNSFNEANQPSILYNTSEQILMHWLQFCANKQIKKWSQCNEIKNNVLERTITNFEYDLQDGVVLIAVTLQYCSYLEPYLKDVYINPSCSEQTFHNASKVIQAWNIINLSFGITPFQIHTPNCLHMLMLVNYLYQVIPSFCANNKLVFKTGLSTTCSKEILVENQSGYVVAYKIIILGNKRKLFSVEFEDFVIQPFKKYKLFITFQAKFLDEELGVLIVNGECFGKSYAKSMAFELVGQSIPSYSTSIINIPMSLYEVKTVELNIQSPYIQTAVYEINFALTEPNSKTMSHIFSSASALHSKIPRRITFFSERVSFDEFGVGVLSITLCSITTNEKSTWIIFTNRTIGDFVINVITTPMLSPEQYVRITVPMAHGFNKTKCLCKKNKDRSLNSTVNSECPRKIVLKIPCKNEFLWKACTELILRVVKEEDFYFWKKYLGTRSGVQIIKWLTELEPRFEDYYDIAQVFQTSVKYYVIIENPSPNIKIAPTTIISDVFSNDFHELHIHVSDRESDLKGFIIKMESRSGFEYRCYNIEFVTKRTNSIPS